MVTMEEYFPFVSKAFDVMQYTAWAILFLITVWQLFRVFGGPITEAEEPWQLVARSALFALLIGFAKPIFTIALDIARAPYTALMDLTMTAEDFTFAGLEQVLTNGLTTIVAAISIVGAILVLILEISLGWNYFKLLLETVEIHCGGCSVLHKPIGLCNGRFQSNQSGIQKLVQDGGLSAPFAGTQCLVPPGIQQLCGPVYRKWRRLIYRTGFHLPLAFLCACFLKNRAEI